MPKRMFCMNTGGSTEVKNWQVKLQPTIYFSIHRNPKQMALFLTSCKYHTVIAQILVHSTLKFWWKILSKITETSAPFKLNSDHSSNWPIADQRELNLLSGLMLVFKFFIDQSSSRYLVPWAIQLSSIVCTDINV